MNKIDVLTFLLKNEDKVNKIKHKHDITLVKSIDKTKYSSFFLGVLHFFILNFLFFIPNLFINLQEYKIATVIFFMGSIFSVGVMQEVIGQSVMHSSKKYFLSFFFKNTKNRLLNNTIFNSFGIVTKKSNKIIEEFYRKLTEEELEFYNELIKEKCFNPESLSLSHLHCCYSFARIYLKTEDKTEILKNKDIILDLIDLFEEGSYQEVELVKLYTAKLETKSKGKYKNNKLNHLREDK
jgi:hypothetical protein